MGMQDRDWWREAQKERVQRAGKNGLVNRPKTIGLFKSLGSTPLQILAILLCWIALMSLLYFAMSHYLKPKPVFVSPFGELVIPRARDGHFYIAGSVNGRPVSFLVDTGASLVTVSEQFARDANLAPGVATIFKTANGDLAGRIVPDVPIQVGPVDVAGIRIGVGLVGQGPTDALLRQSFLSKFEVVLQKSQMILRKR